MSKILNGKVELPNIGKSTKNMIVGFFKAARYFPIDAALTIIPFVLIILYAFDVKVYLEGAAVVLFVYAYFNTREKYTNKKQIEKLNELLKK